MCIRDSYLRGRYILLRSAPQPQPFRLVDLQANIVPVSYTHLDVYKRQILPKAPIYQRIGMNWYIRQQEKGLVKELYISTLLKTHFATAEFAELGIGIGL